MSIIDYIIPSLWESSLQETGIYRFKSYMEDTKQFYGFDIKPGFVDEKKILVKSKTVSLSEVYTEAATMQTDLHNFINIKHLKQKGTVMAQFIPKPGDSVQMMVGIPINEKIQSQNGFLYMYMPASKAIIASYEGKYQHKKEIYSALGKYMLDKFQHPKIAPFEVYTYKMPIDSNDVVSFKLNYLVF